MTNNSDVTVTKNADGSRYEAHIAGQRVGLISYTERDGSVIMPHTEVDPEFGGRGIAGQLTKFALDDVRAEGKSVVPSCPYIAGWIEKHPDYADLVK